VLYPCILGFFSVYMPPVPSLFVGIRASFYLPKKVDRYAYQMRRHKPLAQKTSRGTDLPSRHRNLSKSESIMTILLRIEKIGLRDFLFIRNVPEITTPECPCGEGRQTPKHIIIHCSAYVQGKTQKFRGAGTMNYRKILSTQKGLEAVTS
jgi:hypothetical protein